MESWKRWASWLTTPMLSRSEPRVTRRMSTPPTRTAPPVTSYSRGTRLAIVDLPAPEWPTSATSWPGSSDGSETSAAEG